MPLPDGRVRTQRWNSEVAAERRQRCTPAPPCLTGVSGGDRDFSMSIHEGTSQHKEILSGISINKGFFLSVMCGLFFSYKTAVIQVKSSDQILKPNSG